MVLKQAKKSLKIFQGTITDFITQNDTDKIIELEKIQATEFLSALFTSQEKNGFINLKDGSIVLYNVLEQKLLNKTNIDDNEQIIRLKNSMFNEGLIKNLQNKYKIEIFIQGL